MIERSPGVRRRKGYEINTSPAGPPCEASIPSRRGISGILKFLERKDPSMRISRKLEMLVGRLELLTLRRTVVRRGHWYFVIRPTDHYIYPRVFSVRSDRA